MVVGTPVLLETTLIWLLETIDTCCSTACCAASQAVVASFHSSVEPGGVAPVLTVAERGPLTVADTPSRASRARRAGAEMSSGCGTMLANCWMALSAPTSAVTVFRRSFDSGMVTRVRGTGGVVRAWVSVVGRGGVAASGGRGKQGGCGLRSACEQRYLCHQPPDGCAPFYVGRGIQRCTECRCDAVVRNECRSLVDHGNGAAGV